MAVRGLVQFLQQWTAYSCPTAAANPKRPSSELTVYKLLFFPLTLWIFLAAGCGHHDRAVSVASRTDAECRDYLRLAFALGQRDPDSLDYYYGPASLVVDIRRNPPPLPQIRSSAEMLIQEIQAYPSDHPEGRERQEFLLLQLKAVVARVDLLLGARPPFDQETQEFFGIRVPATVDESRLVEVRAELNDLLPGSGDLARRYGAFERAFVIPPAKLPSVMKRALEGCREQTLKHIELPANEGVTVEYVSNQPWSGFSRYEGNFQSLIEINTDFPLTVDRALQLACHEGYPGHHVYNSLRDLLMVRKQHLAEFMVQPTFSPQSLKSEAAATFAAELAYPGDQRAAFEGNVLFPLAGLEPGKAERYCRVERLVDELHTAEPAIARDYLDGRLEFERAGTALEAQTLMAYPEATLKYINEYRSYMATYTYGLDLVQGFVEQQAGFPPTDAQRWQRYLEIVTSIGPLSSPAHKSTGMLSSSSAESMLASAGSAAKELASGDVR